MQSQFLKIYLHLKRNIETPHMIAIKIMAGLSCLTVFFGVLKYASGLSQAHLFSFVFDLININLLLFGFCLVGGIFENRKLAGVELALFKAGMNFLTAALLLFMSLMLPYAAAGIGAKLDYLQRLAPLIFIFGLLLFFAGIIIIYSELHRHLKKIETQTA